MIDPLLSARVEQWDNITRAWIQSCNIATFEAITLGAGKCQVLNRCHTAVLTCDDMIDFVSKDRVIFMHQTVFAAMPSLLFDRIS